MAFLLKFGYDGRTTNGFVYQNIPDPPDTTEARILKGLKAYLKSDKPIDEIHKDVVFRTASRTDKGVSAIGNILMLEMDRDPSEVAQALNALTRDVFFWAYAEVEPDFKYRFAKTRWYRYYLPGQFDEKYLYRFRNGATVFLGEHNFRGFCREDPTRKEEEDTFVRTIDEISVSMDDNGIMVDIKAKNFLWHMIRKMIWTVKRYSDYEISLAQIDTMLEKGTKDIEIGIAEGENLILMDVEYKDVKFCMIPGIGKDELLKRRETLSREMQFLDLALNRLE